MRIAPSCMVRRHWNREFRPAMKYNRAFTKKIKQNKLTYTTRPSIPLPVKVKAVTITLDDYQLEHSLSYSVTHNGAEILQGSVENGVPVTLSTPLKVARGQHEFQIITGPFNGIDEISGQIQLEFSVF